MSFKYFYREKITGSRRIGRLIHAAYWILAIIKVSNTIIKMVTEVMKHFRRLIWMGTVFHVPWGVPIVLEGFYHQKIIQNVQIEIFSNFLVSKNEPMNSLEDMGAKTKAFENDDKYFWDIGTLGFSVQCASFAHFRNYLGQNTLQRRTKFSHVDFVSTQPL